MSVWASVHGQEDATGLLRRDLESGRVAHAYLFSGSAGRAPFDAALAFGAALNCPEGGCGTCPTCVRSRHQAHPDLEVIEPAGTQLLTDQVREAVRTAWRKPVAGRRRVVVVDQADRMNPNAQNAFLKALEEPPASTVVVLVAPDTEALLETVRSRCREIGFRAPAEAEIARLLAADGLEDADARRWARIGGSFERARALAADPEALQRRRTLVERVLEEIPDPGEALERAAWLAAEVKAVRERVAAEQKAAASEHEEFLQEAKGVADARLRREQRRAEQDALEVALDDVSSVLRDLTLLAAEPDASPLGVDLAGELRARAGTLAPGAVPRLLTCLRDVERARRHLRVNANVLLTLEQVFLSVWRHLR